MWDINARGATVAAAFEVVHIWVFATRSQMTCWGIVLIYGGVNLNRVKRILSGYRTRVFETSKHLLSVGMAWTRTVKTERNLFLDSSHISFARRKKKPKPVPLR
ncbi:Peptidylprolyl isomerase [Psidium guajava]|nr:Peptidylprolyl isomerase [Psidium guajava]